MQGYCARHCPPVLRPAGPQANRPRGDGGAGALARLRPAVEALVRPNDRASHAVLTRGRRVHWPSPARPTAAPPARAPSSAHPPRDPRSHGLRNRRNRHNRRNSRNRRNRRTCAAMADLNDLVLTANDSLTPPPPAWSGPPAPPASAGSLSRRAHCPCDRPGPSLRAAASQPVQGGLSTPACWPMCIGRQDTASSRNAHSLMSQFCLKTGTQAGMGWVGLGTRH